METLFNLLKSALVIILAMVATVAIVMHSAFEQQIPAPVQNDAVCPPLDGWSAHLVQIGENLTILAEIVGVEPAELVIANCLQGDLHPGDTIFLPPPSLGKRACGPPANWVLYDIQAGDSLPLLADQFMVSEEALWHANCISESMTFQPGFRIYVPPVTGTP
jgi:hypothetical protein